MTKSLFNITSTNIIFIFYFDYKRKPRKKLISTIGWRDCSCWQPGQWLEGVRRPCWGHEEWRWRGWVVPSLVSVHSTNAQSGTGGGWRVLDLDHAGPRDQLPVVFPHHELGADDGGADNALQLQRAVLPHVDVRTPEYSHLMIIL